MGAGWAHLVWHSRSANANRTLPRLVRHAHEPFALGIHFADRERLGEVSVVSLVEAGDVNVEDVALVQHIVIRDSVAHNLYARTGARSRAARQGRAALAHTFSRADSHGVRGVVTLPLTEVHTDFG